MNLLVAFFSEGFFSRPVHSNIEFRRFGFPHSPALRRAFELPSSCLTFLFPSNLPLGVAGNWKAAFKLFNLS